MSLNEILDWISLGFEAMGVFVLAVSALIAIARWLTILPSNIKGSKRRNERPVRIELGDRVILALEFLIAADIVQTVKDPSADELGRLAVIVLIRTVLHYSLQEQERQVPQE